MKSYSIITAVNAMFVMINPSAVRNTTTCAAWKRSSGISSKAGGGGRDVGRRWTERERACARARVCVCTRTSVCVCARACACVCVLTLESRNKLFEGEGKRAEKMAEIRGGVIKF